ncbi:hypothetical protein ACFQV4_14300 [Streptomyces thermocarboxydus]
MTVPSAAIRPSGSTVTYSAGADGAAVAEGRRGGAEQQQRGAGRRAEEGAYGHEGPPG